ncbi:MAG: hypoxanthine phosphoribosyltransferase [Clostridiales bacterium]
MTKEYLEEIVSSEEIQKTVKKIADKITNDYINEKLVLIGVLKGGFVFLSDLMRNLKFDINVDFIFVSSYGDKMNSTGVVKIVKDIDFTIENKHVIIVEDIIDTGLTLRYLKELFKTRNPASVKICTIFDKPSKRKVEIDIDYNGIVLEDEFVVGYGLDYAEKYRNLPNLCLLKLEK